MKTIYLLLSMTLHLYAGLFSSVEADVYDLLKQNNYKEALPLINKSEEFDPNYKQMIYLSEDVDVTKALINKGAKLNEKVKREDFIINSMNLKGDEQYYDATPLFNIKNAKVLELLIANGANVNARGKYGETPLMNVKSLDALKVFIANGADVNARSAYGSTALIKIVDNDGRSKEDYTETLKMVLALLLKGANSNIQDNGGHTALHSIRWDHWEIAKALVAFRADISVKTSEGNSPLCYAIADRNMELVKFYFRSGADFSWTCEQDLNLIDYAVKKDGSKARITRFLIDLKKYMENK